MLREAPIPNISLFKRLHLILTILPKLINDVDAVDEDYGMDPND